MNLLLAPPLPAASKTMRWFCRSTQRCSFSPGAYVFVEQPGVGHQPRASVNIPTHSRL
jgi:hypothetical protein